jgi:dual specificity tyrosine-phosphorylation-regulated kinase 2/3/4
LLTNYEQSEIFDYNKIYCLGYRKKKINGSISNTENNYGYDDSRGDYKIILHDHIAYRYEIISFLGKGSFGQVVKVLDVKENKLIALKLIRNRKRFHKQALIEVNILKHLNEFDTEKKNHIIQTFSSFIFRGHLCIAFELLSINLYEFIKNNNFRGLSLSLIRKFAIQILHSLKYIR